MRDYVQPIFATAIVILLLASLITYGIPAVIITLTAAITAAWWASYRRTLL
jgi:hypothetical protein